MVTRVADVRRICFVTGTRAEFGLMGSTLRAVREQAGLRLQVVVTGMHLDPDRGNSIDAISSAGCGIDRIVPWDAADSATRSGTARGTGTAISALAGVFEELRSDVVLVVGDRVEAFAAAAAGHLCGRVVAHVHGGDRAAGQVDDSLRHAITKLSHVHFPATAESARRILKLGEDSFRIRRVGAPGIDGIVATSAPRRDLSAALGPLDWGRFALLLLHPANADERLERRRAEAVAQAVAGVPFSQVVVVYPNNDPGSGGIVRAWKSLERKGQEANRFIVRADLPRPIFLGLLRESAALVGNSSAGIIEAASFRTPVVNIGPRQQGREAGGNVIHVPYQGPALKRSLARIWNGGRPRRAKGPNLYGTGGAGKKIAASLARLSIDSRLMRKLIAY